MRQIRFGLKLSFLAKPRWHLLEARGQNLLCGKYIAHKLKFEAQLNEDVDRPCRHRKP